MPTFDKVTSDANELVFGTLLDGYRRLTIPLFQRSYRWSSKEFIRFREDIEAVVTGDTTTRFIGAVVAVERGYGPNVPTEYEIVDGQQRLFTIYLFVAAAAYVFAKRDSADRGALLLRRFLFLPDFTGQSWNTKLTTSLDDAPEFASLWRQIVETKPLAAALGSSKPRPPAAPDTEQRGKLIIDQFDRLRKWLDAVWKQGGDELLDKYVGAATANLSFVWLSLQDPTSAPRIFESLNNRGVRTTVGDLVRNEIFARLRENPDDARELYEHEWKAFLKGLGDRYESFFFPYGLIVNRNTKKNELFTALRSRWPADTAAAVIITDMQQFVGPFLAVAQGAPLGTDSKEVEARIKRFGRLRLPSAVYPFLMLLLNGFQEGTVSETACADVVDVTESFLVRRALCGYEPTGLHAAFKGLWHEIAGIPSGAAVTDQLTRRSTVQWPSDDELAKCIQERPLYGSAIAHYVILEYDRSLGGDVPDNIPEIEHVLPQKLTREWGQFFDVKSHEALKHTWANLIPLSAPMNRELQQGPYGDKRQRYEADSMFKTPRMLAKTYDEWTPDTLLHRAGALQAFALKRWV